jgi:tripartite-type tricarboxylate transporter receptor subunit TctC
MSATDSRYKTLTEWVSEAKAKPGTVSYGTAGYGTFTHLAVELLQKAGDFKAVQVPYKGAAPAITDLIGGQIDVMIVDMPTGLPHVQSGRLTGLAVTSTKRLPQAPDLPTMSEAGIRGYEMSYWFAAYLPAKTPEPVVRRLNELMVKAVGTEAVKSFFAKSGLEPYTTTPEQLAAFQAAEAEKWGRIIQAAGIQPE